MTAINGTTKCDFPNCEFTSDNVEDFYTQGKSHACKPCKEGFSAKVKSGAIDTAIRYNTGANRAQAELQVKSENRKFNSYR